MPNEDTGGFARRWRGRRTTDGSNRSITVHASYSSCSVSRPGDTCKPLVELLQNSRINLRQHVLLEKLSASVHLLYVTNGCRDDGRELLGVKGVPRDELGGRETSVIRPYWETPNPHSPPSIESPPLVWPAPQLTCPSHRHPSLRRGRHRPRPRSNSSPRWCPKSRRCHRSGRAVFGGAVLYV